MCRILVAWFMLQGGFHLQSINPAVSASCGQFETTGLVLLKSTASTSTVLYNKHQLLCCSLIKTTLSALPSSHEQKCHQHQQCTSKEVNALLRVRVFLTITLTRYCASRQDCRARHSDHFITKLGYLLIQFTCAVSAIKKICGQLIIIYEQEYNGDSIQNFSFHA